MANVSENKWVLNLTGDEIEDALLQMALRAPEGWTRGTIKGVPVDSSSIYYHNNAKYYAELAAVAAEQAQAKIAIFDYTAASSTIWNKINTAYQAGKIVFLKRTIGATSEYRILRLVEYKQTWTSSGTHFAGESFIFTSVIGDSDFCLELYEDRDASTYSWNNLSIAIASKTYVDTGLAGKQDSLTFDDTPIEDSNNPVKSGGIFNALALKASVEQADTAYETALKAFATDTVEGAMVSFPDGADDIPVKSALIKGKTAAINQLVKNGNFADTSAWNKNVSAIVSVSGGVMTVDMANGTSDNRIYQAVSIVSGHIYLLRAMIWADEAMSAGLELSTEANGTLSANNISISTSKTEYALIATAGGTEQCFAIGVKTSFYVRKNLYVSNVGLIDLTLCGFTASETTDVATLKSAWLKKYGTPLPQYIPYNAGSILSNNATYQLTGKNLFDESGATFTDGQRYDYTTGGTVSATNYATCDTYLKVKPDTKYAYGYNKNNGTYSAVAVLYYDESKAFISGEEIIPSNSRVERQTATFTTPANCAYVRFHCAKVKDGIQIEQGNTATTFEPFHDGGSIVADSLNGVGTVADEQDASGAITRRFGVVDLGSLNWTSYQSWWQTTIPDIKYVSVNTQIANAISDTYKVRQASGFTNAVAGELAVDTANIKAKTGTGSAPSSGYLVYELATPTTDTTTPATLTTQKGYNILRTVSGDIQSADATLEYRADTALYIQKVVSA